MTPEGNNSWHWSLVEHFELTSLTKKEKDDAYRAVFELEKDGFIMQDTTQSSDQFKVLTERGEQYVKDSIDDMRLPSVDIDKLLTNDNLRERVRDDYISEAYETIVFTSFNLLE